jgi:alanine racemase
MIYKHLKKVFQKNYYPLNKITVSQDNLIYNYSSLSRQFSPIKIAPVLKSNAYGHGIIQTAKILDPLNPAMFCVDSIYEAYELLKAKIKTNIFIMGYISPQNLKVKPLPFSYAIYDISQMEAINKYQKGAQVHLKVDTGMKRLGIVQEDLSSFLKSALKFKNVKIVGLMSHFADSLNSKNDLTTKQLKLFKENIKLIKDYGIQLEWKHISASDGLASIYKGEILEASNLARVGKAVYGVSKSESLKNLKPTLKLTTQIVQIKELKKGEKVGYASTFIAPRNLKMAVLPIGYNDGVDRRLSNIGYVKVNGVHCKIIGLVSMNITTIDITKVKNPKIGQEVVIFSDNKNDLNCIANSAKLGGTISQEILIHLSPTTIKREVI